SSRSGRALSPSRSPTPRRCLPRSTPTRACARSSSSSPMRSARPATPTAAANIRHKRGSCCLSCEGSDRALPLTVALVLFENVLDAGFIDHQVGLAAVAVQLDAVLVIPLDRAAQLLAIVQHHHHGRARLHLLLIIKIFCEGLFRRRGFFRPGAPTLCM